MNECLKPARYSPVTRLLWKLYEGIESSLDRMHFMSHGARAAKPSAAAFGCALIVTATSLGGVAIANRQLPAAAQQMLNNKPDDHQAQIGDQSVKVAAIAASGIVLMSAGLLGMLGMAKSGKRLELDGRIAYAGRAVNQQPPLPPALKVFSGPARLDI